MNKIFYFISKIQMKLSKKLISEKNIIWFISNFKIEKICWDIKVPQKYDKKRESKRYVIATYITRWVWTVKFMCSIWKYRHIDTALDLFWIRLHKLEKITHRQIKKHKNIIFIK